MIQIGQGGGSQGTGSVSENFRPDTALSLTSGRQAGNAILLPEPNDPWT